MNKKFVSISILVVFILILLSPVLDQPPGLVVSVSAATINPIFPDQLNSFAEGEVIEEEDWNALETYIGIRGTTATSSITYQLQTRLPTLNLSPWQATFAGLALTPTSTAGLFVTASSTIQTSLRVDGLLNLPSLTAGGIVIAGTPATSSSTLSVISGGTGQTSFNSGCMIYGLGASERLACLTIGAANSVLTSTGSTPQWVTGISINSATTTDSLSVGGRASSTSITINDLFKVNSLGRATTTRLDVNTGGATPHGMRVVPGTTTTTLEFY